MISASNMASNHQYLNVYYILLQGYFTDGMYPDRTLLDKIAKDLGLDMNAYNSYMDNKANITAAEQECLQWRGKVQTGQPLLSRHSIVCLNLYSILNKSIQKQLGCHFMLLLTVTLFLKSRKYDHN